MKFSLLLFVLGMKLRLSAFLSEKFYKMIRQQDFVLVIRTADASRARTFYFQSGKIRSVRGNDEKADTELVWADPVSAVKVMLSKNEMDAFSAIGRSELQVFGNFQFAQFFMDLAG